MGTTLLPNFGIYHLTVKDAAELVVEDMWRSLNLVEIEAPDDWDGDINDPRVWQQFEMRFQEFEQTLLAEIDIGRLKPASAGRGFDNRLIADETYVEYRELINWLAERRYYLENGVGETIGSWFEQEMDLFEKVHEHVEYLRAEMKNGLDKTRTSDDPGQIPSAYAAKVLAIIRERDALQAALDDCHTQISSANSATDGAHVSLKLASLKQAARKFWANADRDDRATHPSNATVVDWLVKRGYTESLAEKAATIIRPEWAPTGRKPDE
jgi:hypothetical protein